MANMSYCRFQNTAADLQDCADNWDLDRLSRDELVGMKRILRLVRTIGQNCGADFSDSMIEDDIKDIDERIKEAANA